MTRPKQVAKLLKNLNSNNLKKNRIMKAKTEKNRIMKAKTEKIRVTVTTEEVKELEISFPYYTKDQGMWCKFFSRSVVIWISDYSFKKQIEYSNLGVPEDWIAFDPTTEDEFNAKFNEVMTALIDINNEKDI